MIGQQDIDLQSSWKKTRTHHSNNNKGPINSHFSTFEYRTLGEMNDTSHTASCLGFVDFSIFIGNVSHCSHTQYLGQTMAQIKPAMEMNLIPPSIYASLYPSLNEGKAHEQSIRDLAVLTYPNTIEYNVGNVKELREVFENLLIEEHGAVIKKITNKDEVITLICVSELSMEKKAESIHLMLPTHFAASADVPEKVKLLFSKKYNPLN